MSKIANAALGAAEIAASFVPGLQFASPYLMGLGVSTLLGTAASFLAGGNKGAGVHTQLAYDPSFPRQLVVGRARTAGSLAAQFTHDHLPTGGGDSNKNRVLEMVIALADHECDGLEYILVDGQLVGVDFEGSSTLTPPGTVLPGGSNQRDASLGWRVRYSIDPVTSQPGTDYTNKMWIKFYSGADGQAADTWLHTALGSQWPATSVGQNVCYARITCIYDQNVFSGIPRVEFILRGAKLYDRRLDSTNGGSGSQRWGTPSTYAFSENPCVIAENIARGIFVGGVLFYGASAIESELPAASWTAAMNACDESVSLKAGGSELRYRVGGQTAVNRDATSFLGTVATSMAGYIGTGAGSIAAFPGVSASAAVSITDDDIMALEAYEHAPKFGFDGLKNAVFGTFLDPSQNWSIASLPKRTSNDDIATDGGIELGDTYQFDMVHSGTQGQRLMEIFRRRNRRQLAHTITLRPAAMVIERGDWISWTSAQWSYTAKTFLVVGASVKPNLDIVLNLIETDSTIFSWVP
ncbi:MAG: hypothetical protein ISQ86_10020, partial [Alphaproteobacteria bacterium]|nr:hypothetical protein [Alphaproteobacteria bacterium]